MASTISSLRDRARTPSGQKAVRYMLVSVITVAVSQVAFAGFYILFHWTAKWSNVGACVVGGVPSYSLNRSWAWGKTGRSHLLKEILPFWSLAFLGLILSTFTADFAETWAHHTTQDRTLQAAIIMAAIIGAFGALWVVKFIIFNKVLFVQDEDLRAVLADEIVA